jgi:anti-sigma factor RsiW
MTNMEHKEAVRLNAAEKYLMGEMAEAQREEYEEHYFDCVACATELKATVAFLESAKDVVRQQVLLPVAANVASAEAGRDRVERGAPGGEKRGGFFAWLAQPVFAGAACAVLLGAVALAGYQNAVTIPQLKESLAMAYAPRIVSHYSLLAAGARGDGDVEVRVRPNEEFALDVDVPVTPGATGFVAQVQDALGNIRVALPVSAEQAKSTVSVEVPGGGLAAGKYSVVLFAQAADAGSSNSKEVKRLPFSVVFKQ